MTNLVLYPHCIDLKPITLVTSCSHNEALCYSPHHIKHHQKLGEPEDTSQPYAWNNQCFWGFIIKHIMETVIAASSRSAHRCTRHTVDELSKNDERLLLLFKSLYSNPKICFGISLALAQCTCVRHL